VVTAAVTFRNFEKNVSIRCRNVAHQIAEREFVWAESPIDLTRWNSPDDIHRALMDFSEIPEKLLRVTNFHVYPPFFEKREERTGHGGDAALRRSSLCSSKSSVAVPLRARAQNRWRATFRSDTESCSAERREISGGSVTLRTCRPACIRCS
jgi:hypothetical protein